jgi:hypothetical protein
MRKGISDGRIRSRNSAVSGSIGGFFLLYKDCRLIVKEKSKHQQSLEKTNQHFLNLPNRSFTMQFRHLVIATLCGTAFAGLRPVPIDKRQSTEFGPYPVDSYSQGNSKRNINQKRHEEEDE